MSCHRTVFSSLRPTFSYFNGELSALCKNLKVTLLSKIMVVSLTGTLTKPIVMRPDQMGRLGTCMRGFTSLAIFQTTSNFCLSSSNLFQGSSSILTTVNNVNSAGFNRFLTLSQLNGVETVACGTALRLCGQIMVLPCEFWR